MRNTRRGARLHGLAVVPALFLMGACAAMEPNIRMTEEIVMPITVGQVTAVKAYDLAAAMRRAGFSDEEIIQHGPVVRNALATSGGAQIRRGKEVSAVFSVFSEKLYVTSRTRGTFVQELGQTAPISARAAAGT